MKHLTLILLPILFITTTLHAQIPADSRQLIIGIAPHKNSSHVTLSIFERPNTSSTWKQQGAPWKGRLGRNGLAWGIGLHPFNGKGPIKKEGDGRSPTGIFRIGSGSSFAFGYAPSIKKLPTLPYKQITKKDLWVEDSKSPHYNRHLTIKHLPKTNWEKKAQMRQGDYAHSLKLFIAHNAGTKTKPATPNAGSSIFFHIWRGGGSKPTAGCTTMHANKLKHMISKIDPLKKPIYILLTHQDYKKFSPTWKLP